MAEEKNEPEVQLNVRVPTSLREKIYAYLPKKDKMKYFVQNVLEEFFSSKKIALSSRILRG